MNEKLKNLLNEEQDPKSVEKIYAKVSDLLTKGEEIRYIAVQKKPAINLSPDGIVLTDKRVIFCRPKNLGLSMVFQDYQWKDVADVHMKEGILGAEFKLRTVRGQSNLMEYLPKAQARKLYQFGQEKEEENREIRRQRDLEDKRAMAGGVTVTTSVPAAATIPSAHAVEGHMEKLQKLKMMLENQLISQEEFDKKKAEILAAF